MTYPRRCPLCGADYDPRRLERPDHMTLRAEAGGTPSPSRPDLPGRLLTLRCRACGGEYLWDYFAGRPSASPDRGHGLPQDLAGPQARRAR